MYLGEERAGKGMVGEDAVEEALDTGRRIYEDKESLFASDPLNESSLRRLLRVQDRFLREVRDMLREAADQSDRVDALRERVAAPLEGLIQAIDAQREALAQGDIERVRDAWAEEKRFDDRLRRRVRDEEDEASGALLAGVIALLLVVQGCVTVEEPTRHHADHVEQRVIEQPTYLRSDEVVLPRDLFRLFVQASPVQAGGDDLAVAAIYQDDPSLSASELQRFFSTNGVSDSAAVSYAEELSRPGVLVYDAKALSERGKVGFIVHERVHEALRHLQDGVQPILRAAKAVRHAVEEDGSVACPGISFTSAGSVRHSIDETSCALRVEKLVERPIHLYPYLAQGYLPGLLELLREEHAEAYAVFGRVLSRAVEGIPSGKLRDSDVPLSVFQRGER